MADAGLGWHGANTRETASPPLPGSDGKSCPGRLLDPQNRPLYYFAYIYMNSRSFFISHAYIKIIHTNWHVNIYMNTYIVMFILMQHPQRYAMYETTGSALKMFGWRRDLTSEPVWGVDFSVKTFRDTKEYLTHCPGSLNPKTEP